MDRKKQAKPQTRRDSNDVVRGGVHGNQSDTENTIDATSTAPAIKTEQRSIQEKAGRLGAEATVENIVVGMVFARSKTFTAKPCTSCEALRQSGTNYTRVYATRGNVRYCRCHYCGNTWKDT